MTERKQGKPLVQVLAAENGATTPPQIEFPPAPTRIELDSGNWAILDQGLIKIYLSSGQELFSIDGNSMAFTVKSLAALMQVYLLGFNRGRTHERERLESKVKLLHQLVFEK